MGKRGIVTKASCKGLGAWTQAVGWAARGAGIRLAPVGTGVKVIAVFQSVKPTSQKKRKHPAVKPDIDKLARALLDALTGVAYVDDGQVIELKLWKVYGGDARTTVTVKQDG